MKPLTYADQVERVLWSWPRVVEAAENDWAKGFALSIAKQSRRRGWRPSPKQLALMKNMVAQIYARDGDEGGDGFDVIER